MLEGIGSSVSTNATIMDAPLERNEFIKNLRMHAVKFYEN